MTGVVALSRLEVRRAMRNRRVMFFTVLYPAILFLLIGESSKGTLGGVDTKTYILISMATFGALSGAMTNNAQKIATERKEGWTKQLRLTALPPNGYVIGKVVSATVLIIPAIVIVFAIGAASGVHLPADKWVLAFVLIWITSLAFTALGIAIGYGVPTDTVQMVTLFCYFGLSIVGGLWIPITGGVMQKVADFTPTYQVRQMTTNLVTGQSISAVGGLVLAVWLVGSIAVASAVYRRGGADS
jgi:ABC-2 type transport system permease protein